ncbi:MAG TPA: hypothetical protein VEY71_00960 [Chitinophagales bacterium]|nr:hypothetical protein [Chitinophagales bacterium]
MRVNVSKHRHYSGHQGAVYALIKGKGLTVFSSGGDGAIMRWNLEEDRGEKVGQVPGTVFALHHLPETDYMIAGTMEGDVIVLDLVHNKIVNKQRLDETAVFDIRLLPGSELFTVLTGSGTLWMMDFEYNAVGKVDLTKASLRGFAYDPLGKALAIGSSDHKIYVNTDPVLDDWKVLDGPTHSVFSVAFDHTGRRLYAGSRDAHLYAFDVDKDHEQINKVNAHMYTINHIVPSDSKDLIFTASRDKHIKIWNSRSLDLVKVIDYEKLDAHTHSVNKLLLIEPQNLLISASDDRSVMVWQLDFPE